MDGWMFPSQTELFIHLSSVTVCPALTGFQVVESIPSHLFVTWPTHTHTPNTPTHTDNLEFFTSQVCSSWIVGGARELENLQTQEPHVS